MKPGIDPKVDFAFKRVFGVENSRGILIDLIHSVLAPPPDERITDIELLNPFNEKETPTDRLTILDIKARDQRGRQFNIEMQMIGHAWFPQRILYYWATIHQQQLQEGENYSVLRPTISICFLNDTLFPAVPDYHLTFHLVDRRHDVTFAKDIELHLIELPKFTGSPDELSGPLGRWIYFLVHGERLDVDALPAPLETPEIRRALEELEMLTKSQLERDLYESRLKAIRDDVARQKGAFERGIDQGRTEGEMVGRIHALEVLLDRPRTSAEELLSMPRAELDRLTEQLQSEIRGRH